MSTGPLDLDDAPIFDADALSVRCFGDRDLAAELLFLFVTQCRSVGPQILSTSDPAALRDSAHALRGSASAIGAERLAAALALIEEAANGGGSAPEARRDLARLIDRTVEAAEARLSEPDPLAKPGGLA